MKKIIFLIIFSISILNAADWPVYKGNLYYTGNNDEITVKNGNLKWLFQAGDIVHNPILSDGKIYFIDQSRNVYCLDEDSGKLLWKIDLFRVASQFTSNTKAMGKIKYPLIKDNKLFITDTIAIYCLDKNSGNVIWGRTGLRESKSFNDYKSPLVDGIYSDPVINGDRIYYGTRNVFISREIINGHQMWDNIAIKSYSGFPSFYDKYILTQSMDYGTGKFVLYCISSETGEVVWSSGLEKPVKLFSPVVYKGLVYLASGFKLFAFDLDNGKIKWAKDYGQYITSNPSFTERELVFTLNNDSIVSVSAEAGEIKNKISLGEKSSPYFVMIRNQIYAASTFNKPVGGKEVPFTRLKLLNNADGSASWEFVSPFPGGSGQPSASKGIMFLPGGNYLYAVGTDYYPRLIDGGGAIYDPYDKDTGKKDKDTPINKIDDNSYQQTLKMRKMTITAKGKDKGFIPAELDIIKWDKGKIIYSKKIKISKPDFQIEIPDADDVEITASADGFVPKKTIISRDDLKKEIELDQIEKGKEIVVDNIYFETNEAYLKKESLNILDKMAEYLKNNRRVKIEVRGHTDATGTREHNKKLSERRADSVAEYMIKNGVSPEQIKSEGYGFDKPIGDNRTEPGRKKNRRTEFYIIDK